MSISLMSAVWRMDLPPTDKMVLLALADAANDDGVTWMAIKSKRAGKLDFITKTSLSQRAIQASMKRLSEGGLIERVHHEGKGVLYTVTLGGVQEMHPACGARGGAGDAPKPSNNRSPNGETYNTRAKRYVPDDWKPSEADYQVGIDEGLSDAEIIRATAKFRDHTFGRARSDWSKTYRNWLRETSERKIKPNDHQRPSPKSEHLERVARAMAASVGGEFGERERDSPEPGSEGGSVPRLTVVGGNG